MLFLFQLPEDVLYLILSYLDSKSLSSLSQVCKKINHFTSRDAVWRRIAKHCINTGITRQGTDLFPRIPLKDRVKVSQNWCRGRCRRETVLKWKFNLLPWLQLDSSVLYLSQAADIRAYQLRADGGGLQRKPLAVFSGHQEDVCRFVLTDSHLISAGGDGKIILHQRRSSFSVEYCAHNQEVNCVDSRGGVIVSGSRDRTARVWSLSSNRLGECLHTIPTLDRVWSVAISPSQRFSGQDTGPCVGQYSPCCLSPGFITVLDRELMAHYPRNPVLSPCHMSVLDVNVADSPQFSVELFCCQNRSSFFVFCSYFFTVAL
ncbi:F-box/WD repeat-containing protein 4 isoform X2 [Lepisosteus oculatus]|uniref:F-box/WD repeat-containing protein 4 isoform X2 n=1 Tax=Lepisosteus oculatus TaxID=7918 RepID=UPI0037152FFF